MFHTSDCKKAVRCPRYFWLAKHQSMPTFTPYVRMDEDLSQLACQKLQIKDYFQGIRNDDPQRSMIALTKYDWLVSARFEYLSLRVKVPFLHRHETGWDVLFLYGGHLPKDDETMNYTWVIWVLQNCGLEIRNIEVLHYNPNYIRGQQLDPQLLFLCTDRFYNDAGNPTKCIKKAIETKLKDFSPLLKQMEEWIQLPQAPQACRTNRCTRRNKCVYYDQCFPDEQILENDSIMTLISSRYKTELVESGITSLAQVDMAKIEGTRQQFAQIKAAKQGGLYIDYFGLKTWLEGTLKYPYCFLDFEWETYAVPPYEGMKSYQVLPFQYSLHILQEDGTLTHQEFLGVQDCRQEFIERLLADLPKKGSVIAYNAEGAEKLRIKELATYMPTRSRDLMKIHNRMVDLSFPFQIGMVYDTRMRGYYSLKVLLSLFDENLTYQDLPIHQGMDAVLQWRNLDQQNEEINEEEIRDQLSEYCGLDTYSMIVVLNWLNDKLTLWEVETLKKEETTAMLKEEKK